MLLGDERGNSREHGGQAVEKAANVNVVWRTYMYRSVSHRAGSLVCALMMLLWEYLRNIKWCISSGANYPY